MTAYAAGGLVYALLARRALRRFGERARHARRPRSGGRLWRTCVRHVITLATVCIASVGVGFTLHTTVQTHVTHVAPEERGSAVALFATSLFLGQASGVWLGAQIVDAAGSRRFSWLQPSGSRPLTTLLPLLLVGRDVARRDVGAGAEEVALGLLHEVLARARSARFRRFSFTSIVCCLSHCAQASFETFSQMRLPSAPVGGKSSPRPRGRASRTSPFAPSANYILLRNTFEPRRQL